MVKLGVMMFDGLMIWLGVLCGEESFGMICLVKELCLLNVLVKKGILELFFDVEVGFVFVVGE